MAAGIAKRLWTRRIISNRFQIYVSVKTIISQAEIQLQCLLRSVFSAFSCDFIDLDKKVVSPLSSSSLFQHCKFTSSQTLRNCYISNRVVTVFHQVQLTIAVYIQSRLTRLQRPAKAQQYHIRSIPNLWPFPHSLHYPPFPGSLSLQPQLHPVSGAEEFIGNGGVHG